MNNYSISQVSAILLMFSFFYFVSGIVGVIGVVVVVCFVAVALVAIAYCHSKLGVSGCIYIDCQFSVQFCTILNAHK